MMKALFLLLTGLTILNNKISLASSSDPVFQDKVYNRTIYLNISLTNRKDLSQSLCRSFKKQTVISKVNSKLQCHFSSDFHYKDIVDGNKVPLVIEIKERDEDILLTFNDVRDIPLKLTDIKWNISKDAKIKDYKKLFKRILSYYKNKSEFENALIDKVIENDPNIKQNFFTGMYQYTEDEGYLVNKDILLRSYILKNKKQRNFLLASLEIAIFLGIGKWEYERTHSNQLDWDFDNKTPKDYAKRITTTNQIRFDDNSFLMNGGHIMAGYLYNTACRTNGYKNYECLLVTLAASSVWEYFLENKEVVSINDQVATGIGGAIVGETIFQISEMLKRKNTLPGNIAAAILNPIGSLNDFLNGTNANQRRKNYLSSMGFNEEDLFSEFNVSTGVKYAYSNKKKHRSLLNFNLEAEVVNFPIKGAGKVHELIVDTTVANLVVDANISDKGLENLYILTKSILVGYHQKNIKLDKEKREKGYSMLLGIGGAVEYSGNGIDAKAGDDFYAVVDVLGASLDVTIYRSGYKLRFGMDVYGNFAFVKPFAHDNFTKNGHNYDGSISVLDKQGYYYALGTTMRSKVELTKGRFRVGLGYTDHSFNSVSPGKWDRFGQPSKDLTIKDRHRRVKVWLGYKVTNSFEITAILEAISKKGKIKSKDFNDIFASSDEFDLIGGLSMQYKW